MDEKDESMKVYFLVIGIVVLAIFALLGLIFSTSEDPTSTAQATYGNDTGQPIDEAPTTTLPTSCIGKNYPDKQNTDECANASGILALGLVAVTATPFKKIEGNYLTGPMLCAGVRIENNSNQSVDYSYIDFKIQPPSGNMQGISTTTGYDPRDTKNQLINSGTLIAGASVTGAICGDDPGERGQYVFIYKPDPFSNARGTWLFNV